MAKNRLCDIEIWNKDWFLELSDTRKLLCKFLFDNCDCAGFYKISWKLLKVFFNSEISKEDFLSIKQVKFIDDDLIFIEDFVLFQYKIRSFKELNPKNKAHLGALRLLKKYNIFDYENQSPFEAPLKPLESPFEGAQEKEGEKEKEKEKDKEQEKEILQKEEKKEKEKKEEKIFDFEGFVSKIKELYPKAFKENPNEGVKYAFLRGYNPKSIDFNLLLELALKANTMSLYPPNTRMILDVLPRARIEVKEEAKQDLRPPTDEEDAKSRELVSALVAKYGSRKRAISGVDAGPRGERG